jgi:hypothetical protein
MARATTIPARELARTLPDSLLQLRQIHHPVILQSVATQQKGVDEGGSERGPPTERRQVSQSPLSHARCARARFLSRTLLAELRATWTKAAKKSILSRTLAPSLLPSASSFSLVLLALASLTLSLELLSSGMANSLSANLHHAKPCVTISRALFLCFFFLSLLLGPHPGLKCPS